MARAAVLVLFACLLLPGAAAGRVVVVGTGGPSVVLTDVGTDVVGPQIAVGGRTGAVAIAPDGLRAYVASGRRVAAVDLIFKVVVETAQLPAPVLSLAVTPDGARVLAGRRGAVEALDAATLAPAARVGLGRAAAHAIAVEPDGTRAAIALGPAGAGILSLRAGRMTVRRTLPGAATGVAWGARAGGAPWFSFRGGLVAVDPLRGRLRGRVALGPDLGGSVALSPVERHAVVGAAGRRPQAGVVDLRSGRVVMRVPTGRGPGSPSFSPDGSRLYVANRGAAVVSVLSGYSYRRLGIQRVRAVALAVQPGLALLAGTEGADRLIGTRDADLVVGLGGDDHLDGRRGRDVVYGGPGNDVLDGGGNSDLIDAGEGNDRVSGSNGVDFIKAGPGDDNVQAGTANDGIDGGPGNDYIDGGDGLDVVLGGEGDDKIVESALGPDPLLDGGPGNDYIDGGRAPDNIVGGEGDDQLFGGGGGERIDGGPGRDTIDAGLSPDVVFGRDGDDAIRGDVGRDRLFGAQGADAIDAGSGDDIVSGGEDNDWIAGGPGADLVDAGAGDDEVRVADGDADTVDCGAGRDVVHVEQDAPQRDTLRRCERVVPIPPEASTDAPPTSNIITGTAFDDTLFGTPGIDTMRGEDGDDELDGGEGDDYVDGENGFDVVRGGPGDDDVYGRRDDDRVYGDEGDDYVQGDRGDDEVHGGPGNDRMEGGLDDDTLYGGEGDDRISVYTRGRDRVFCGPGHDVVRAGPEDETAQDCEDVGQ